LDSRKLGRVGEGKKEDIFNISGSDTAGMGSPGAYSAQKG
jgi:hypothetical protein